MRTCRFDDNARQGRRRFAAIRRIRQERAPGLELAEESRHVNFHPAGFESRQFSRSLFKQRPKPFRIAARVVVERCGDLNQPVQEDLFVPGGSQPHGLQRFVRLEKFLRVEKVNALADRLVHPLSL